MSHADTAQTVVVFGVARLRVIRGRISIGGAVLTPSSPALDLYAPSTHPLPVIAALASSAPEPSTSAAATILPDASVVVRLESLQSGLAGIERPLQASGVLARSERMWPRAEGRTFELVRSPSPRRQLICVGPRAAAFAVGTARAAGVAGGARPCLRSHS